MKKMFRSLIAVVIMAVLVSACQSYDDISMVLGADVNSAKVISKGDDHGGFHGDGERYIEFEFEDDTFENTIKEDNTWNALPVKDDTITALLGKDKKIAAVIDADSVGTDNIGYLISAGIKNYDTDNNKKVSEYYISVVMTNGELVEYKARTDFSNYINSIVEITFKNDLASISKIRENNKKDISGIFNAESMYIGNYAVSKHVDIIDIGTTDNNKSALYVTVKPQRLDGVRLSSSNILYYEMNEKNAITKLVLKNVTGDYYSYGIVTKVKKDSERMFGTYNYNIDGSEKVHSTQNSVLGVSTGPAKIIFSNNSISSMTNLTKISGKIEELNNTYATVGNNHYLLDDNVKIYYKNYNWDYMLITMEDLLEDDDYQIVGVYYDKSITSGGRVRVILVTKN